MPMDGSFVGKRITELRLARNISEYQMSLELGQSRSYIQGITAGKHLPSLSQLLNIADYFDVTLSEFFAEDDNEKALTPAQLDAIREIRAMSDEDAKLILSVMRRFGKEQAR